MKSIERWSSSCLLGLTDFSGICFRQIIRVSIILCDRSWGNRQCFPYRTYDGGKTRKIERYIEILQRKLSLCQPSCPEQASWRRCKTHRYRSSSTQSQNLHSFTHYCQDSHKLVSLSSLWSELLWKFCLQLVLLTLRPLPNWRLEAAHWNCGLVSSQMERVLGRVNPMALERIFRMQIK